jgi:hypothetical protein
LAAPFFGPPFNFGQVRMLCPCFPHSEQVFGTRFTAVAFFFVFFGIVFPFIVVRPGEGVSRPSFAALRRYAFPP